MVTVWVEVSAANKNKEGRDEDACVQLLCSFVHSPWREVVDPRKAHTRESLYSYLPNANFI